MKTKKWLILLMVFALFFTACAANGNAGNDKESGSGNESKTEAQDDFKGQFRVGYARYVITPIEPVPLAGYGNTDRRLSDGFLDDIFVTCVAITGTNDETILWFTSDLINIRQNELAYEMKDLISAETGVPVPNINLCFTHTHSSVDLETSVFKKFLSIQKFYEDYKTKAVKAAVEAMADRELTTKMEYGVADLTGFNFVKHYYTDLDEVVGDNHGGYAKGTVNRHTTGSNHNMYLLRFDRETKKDVLLSTFRGHPTMTGGSIKTDISSDAIYPLREGLEETEDCLFAYYQGEAGNHNLTSRLAEENVFGGDYLKWGEAACDRIRDTLASDMVEVKTGAVYCDERRVTLNVNHTLDDKKGVAAQVSAYWKDTDDRNGIWQICYDAGLESPYHAGAIVSRASQPASYDVEINGAVIGDFVMAAAPFETFHTNGDFIRENSPSEYHFVIGYSNEARGYLPSQFGYDYGCYEADTSTFEPGSGEILASAEVEMLNDLWKKSRGE